MYFRYIFLYTILFSMHCLAMEIDQTLNTRTAFLKFNEHETREIKINNHFFKTDYFSNFNSFDNGESIIIEPQFEGLVPGTHEAEGFIESLSNEYNIINYFNFFNKNSIRNLYKMYTWYEFIDYQEMKDIICAVILVKACTLGLVNVKSYVEFTQCVTCRDSKNNGENRNRFNFTLSNNYQDNHDENLIKKISDNIPQDIKKHITQSETIKHFGADIKNILKHYNTSQFNKENLEKVLCNCHKIEIKDNKDDEPQDVLQQIDEKKCDDQDKLKKLICQKLAKFDCQTVVGFSDLEFDVSAYFNVKEFSKANINSVVFNNVTFKNLYSGCDVGFLNGLRDPEKNEAQSINIYLTGKETKLTGRYKWFDAELTFQLLYTIYKKGYAIGNHSTKLLTPATLFVDSETVNKNLQKKLQCNSLYYTQYYFYYNMIKKMLKETSDEVLFSIPFGSLADLICSFCYNAAFARVYGFSHFLIPIPLLLGTVIFGLNNLTGCTCCSGEDIDPVLRNRMHRQRTVAKRWLFVCVALIAVFYIYKEVKYKPSGWHTYSFFPWTAAAIHIALVCSAYIEKNQHNYEEIKHGKVEFIKNIDEHIAKNV